MALTVHINTGSTDNTLQTSGTTFTQWEEGSDTLIFTGGNATVADGQPIPSQAELNSAGVDLSSVSLPFTLTEYLMSDNSANLLRDIDLMGNQNKRYVVAADFDASTASEPVAEFWDDDTLSTVTGTFLGAGTPANSFVRGVTTTSGLPGAGWASTGTRMAGSGSGNFLFLNDENGALSGATTLYFNLAVIIPSGQTTGFSNQSVLVIKYLSV